MTRYVIDAPAAVELARRGFDGKGPDRLVAPSVLMSQTLSLLHRAVARGELSRAEGRALLDGVTTMSIRLLGDRVSRGTAWTIADELGLDDTGLCEYLAVCRLQADALIALDPDLQRIATGVVATASIDDLERL